MSGLFGLLPLLMIAMIFPAFRAIAAVVSVPAKLRREPACERCGYGITGLTTLSCPECGTDLRTTGIITLAMELRRRGSVAGAICGWIFIMFIAAGIGTSVLAMLQFGATLGMGAGGGSTTTVTPLTPASAAYKSIDVTATFNYGAGMPTGSTDFLLILADKSQWILKIDTIAATYTIFDPSNSPVVTAALDSNTPDAFFTAAGLDPKDPKINAECRELSTILAILETSPYTAVNTMKLRAFAPGTPVVTASSLSPQSTGTPDWTTTLWIAAGIAWVVLLVAGLIYIPSRRRRLLRQYAPQHPVPAAPLTA